MKAPNFNLQTKQFEESNGWKFIPTSNHEYMAHEIGEVGRILYNGRFKILEGHLDDDGYRRVYVRLGWKGKRPYFIHQLIAFTFYGDYPEGKPTIRHLDGNKLNNHYSNLRYGTVKEQADDDFKNGVRIQVLDEQKAANIVKLRKEGKLVREVAEAVGVKEHNVAQVLYRKDWTEEDPIKVGTQIRQDKFDAYKKLFELRAMSMSFKDVASASGVAEGTVVAILEGRYYKEQLYDKFSYMIEGIGQVRTDKKMEIDELKELFVLRAQGWTHEKIAEKVGYSREQVRDILAGKKREEAFEKFGYLIADVKKASQKITEEDAEDIFRRYASGEKCASIGRSYNVKGGAIKRIIFGQRQPHLLKKFGHLL